MSYRSNRVVSVLVTCLAATAGFSLVDAQCSADPWADGVIESSFTGGDPMSVLGAPDGTVVDFEESGTDPGFVTVVFSDDLIVDGPGNDFVIHVFDFPQSEIVEAFEVLVSEDGVTFVSLGMVFPTVLMGNMAEVLGFDLAGSGLAVVTQVMVVGLNVDSLNQGEGVDIDAFEALNCEAPMGTDLMACLDDLDACDTELGICEGDLGICDSGFDTCLDNLGRAQTDLRACEDELVGANASIDEGLQGLAEIRRLIALPPGHRQSYFACSGDLCDEIQAAIGMLLAPPGQNVSRVRGRKR